MGERPLCQLAAPLPCSSACWHSCQPDAMGTRQGGHVVWWSPTVPMLSLSLRGAWPTQDAQPWHTAPLAALALLSPAAAAHSPGCALVGCGLSSGLGEGHMSPRQPVPCLCGAPALPSCCMPLPAAGAGLLALHHTILRCSVASPVLSMQAVMEVLEPLVHIHVFAGGDPKSSACLPRLLSGSTVEGSVLSQVAVGLCPAQGQG